MTVNYHARNKDVPAFRLLDPTEVKFSELAPGQNVNFGSLILVCVGSGYYIVGRGFDNNWLCDKADLERLFAWGMNSGDAPR